MTNEVGSSASDVRNDANIRNAKLRFCLWVWSGLGIMVATPICVRAGVDFHGIPTIPIAWFCVTRGFYWYGRKVGIKSTLEESG